MVESLITKLEDNLIDRKPIELFSFMIISLHLKENIFFMDERDKDICIQLINHPVTSKKVKEYCKFYLKNFTKIQRQYNALVYFF